jgi:rhamnose utilization protein RhaD (predicted bifunctional aldolase and dehydrogenase)
MDLKALIKMSRKYGSDPDYVLAGGGNTSYKENNVMAVKASGGALSSIDESGFVMMDTGKLQALVMKKYPEDDKEREACALKDMMDARLEVTSDKRPSVECILHALFPERFVLHVHPALINGLTCSQNGRAAAMEIFDDIKESFLWVPLVKPGYVLSKTCSELMENHASVFGKKPSIVLLQNHGIIVAADDPNEIDMMMEDIVSRIDKRIIRRPDLSANTEENPEFNSIKNTVINELEKLYGGSVVYMYNKEIALFTSSFDAYSPLVKPLSPDYIVYCRAYPVFAESIDELEIAFNMYDAAYGGRPKIVAVRGLGAFALGKETNEAGLASVLYLDRIKIVIYSESFGGPLTLPDDFTDFIVNWESESYRQKQSF